jgi:2-polyprenyl-3-methyl-5-hydroxy-6-metoxy-1,4-benzoquinol methylase
MTLPPENIFGHTKKLRYILNRIADVIRENPTATILDFGCGNGVAVAQYLIGALPETARYVGVDLHPASIEFASRHFGRSNATFTERLPDACDAIVYADVLEHLDEPAAILDAHARILRPGGIIVGSIPNGVGPFELESALDRRFRISARIASVMARVRGRPSDETPYNIDSGHVQFYRRRAFEQMLVDAGFHITDFRNGCFFGGMVTERVLRIGGQPLFRGNSAVAAYLPYWAVSTWLFSAARPA